MLASVLFVPVTVHLSEFNSFSTGGTSVTFTGTFPVGPPVVQSFVLDDDVTTTETLSLASFTGVKYLQWDSVHQIDNICIVSACADGLDNDGDRLIDLADPDCHDSSDQDERLTAIAVPSLATPAKVLVAAALALLGYLSAPAGLCATRVLGPRARTKRSGVRLLAPIPNSVCG